MKHTLQVSIARFPNQYGFNLSLIKLDEKGELVGGFTLNNFKTQEECTELGKELARFMNIEVSDF